jgi:hypothetical protein
MDRIKNLNSFEKVEALVSKVLNRRILNSSIMENYLGQGRLEYKLIFPMSQEIKRV